MQVSMLQSRVLGARSGVVHGFTTRDGGVSTGALASLNLALREGEQAHRLVANWDRVAAALDPRWSGARVVLLSQVHGATVLEASEPTGPLQTLGEADGLVTTERGLILAIRTADCVPILLAGPRCVAAVHAGWRGVAARIVPQALEEMARLGDDPSEVTAAIGPCISAAAYEVGHEVVEGLAEAGIPEEIFVREGTRGRPHVDLAEAVRWQLREVADVDHVARCTLSSPSLYSHRGGGSATGRQASVIARL